MPLSPADRATDMSACADEPIHIPGAIQPHGALLAALLDNGRISHASANLAAILGRPAGAVLGRALGEAIGKRAAGALLNSVQGGRLPPDGLPSWIEPCGERLHLGAHVSGRHLIVEFEPMSAGTGGQSATALALSVIDTCKHATTQLELCTIVVSGLRTITGYDRVMAYRFAADGHGEVIAESRRATLAPYLGQHYPTSDIPEQARRLYVRKRIGIVADAGYEPVPLLVAPALDNGLPLDLSESTLRSVSPLHRAYMRNMTTAASLTIALVRRSDLWGMLVCHHSTPRRPGPRMCAAANMIGQVVSLLLESLGAAEVAAQRLSRIDALNVLAEKIAGELPLMEALPAAQHELLAVLDAGGVALRFGGGMLRLGRTPPREAIDDAMATLLPAARGDALAVDDLSLRDPTLARCAEDGSGVLLMPLASAADDAIVWFRPETVRTIVWGGNPAAHAITDASTGKLSPRESFAAWRETVRGRSAPWREADLATARGVRHAFETEIARRTRADLAQARYQLAVADARDVRQRTDAERMLAELEGRYRALLDTAPDAMVVVNQSGTIVLVNLRTEQQFDCRREILLGQQLSTIIPDASPAWLRARARALPDQVRGFECMGIREQGGVFPIEIMLNAVGTADDPLLTVSIRDITLRKAQENHLARVEARHRGLLQAAPDAMVMADADGRIVLVNNQAERQFGYASAELIGQNVEIIVPGGLVTTAAELSGRRKSGALFPIEVNFGQLESEEGMLTAAAIRDISARKKSESELLRTVRELHRSNEELDQFAAIASHDLQEPLRMVSSYTQLLARRYKGRLDADADDFINYAVDGANRMQQLIQDLLAYSRIRVAGRKAGTASSSKALSQALAALRGPIEQSGAVITCDDLPVVPVEESQLTQLFQNLVANAIKYRGPDYPKIHISATMINNERWMFTVRDNGLGIENRYFQKIFGMFQRLHKRDEYSGTGMGLAICKKIVEFYGGAISVESQPGVGSSFRFTLPAAARTS